MNNLTKVIGVARHSGIISTQVRFRTPMIKFIGKLIDELGDNQNILEDYTASLNDRTKRLENVLGDFKLLKVESDLLKDKVNIYMNAKCILFGRKFF